MFKNSGSTPTTAATSQSNAFIKLDRQAIKELYVDDILGVRLPPQANGYRPLFKGKVVLISKKFITMDYNLDGDDSPPVYAHHGIDANIEFFYEKKSDKRVGQYSATAAASAVGTTAMLSGYQLHADMVNTDAEGYSYLTPEDIELLIKCDIECMLLMSSLPSTDYTLRTLKELKVTHSLLREVILQYEDNVLIDGVLDKSIVERWQSINLIRRPSTDRLDAGQVRTILQCDLDCMRQIRSLPRTDATILKLNELEGFHVALSEIVMLNIETVFSDSNIEESLIKRWQKSNLEYKPSNQTLRAAPV